MQDDGAPVVRTAEIDVDGVPEMGQLQSDVAPARADVRCDERKGEGRAPSSAGVVEDEDEELGGEAEDGGGLVGEAVVPGLDVGDLGIEGGKLEEERAPSLGELGAQLGKLQHAMGGIHGRIQGPAPENSRPGTGFKVRPSVVVLVCTLVHCAMTTPHVIASSSSHPSQSLASSSLVGGHYRAGKKIGEGSFGVVFEGRAPPSFLFSRSPLSQAQSFPPTPPWL